MKEYNLLVSTKLKTKDPVAATVKTVLTADMGYGGIVLEVLREELWAVEASARDRNAAYGLCEKVALNTWVLYNPNKHLLSLDVKEKGLPFLEGRKHTPPVYDITVVTRFNRDEKENSALKFLNEILPGAGRFPGVKKFTLWHIKIKAGSRDEAVSVAHDIAEARSIGSGLLANLNSQEFQVVD